MWHRTTRVVPRFLVALPALAILVAGCATQRPVLYPNGHYNSVGAEAAQADVDWCLQYADEHGAGASRGAQAAGSTAKGAVVGGAGGAAAGAVFGNAAKGAAGGAAGGAAVGLTRSLFDSAEPDEVRRRFVERCLRDLGYEPVGWR
ncbi:MAG: hypothetical protein R3286_08565 [Gammaproteobacteria bacterium]|nr:hypothetical protein [Gammaproteobacteria bacterium]